MIRSVAILAVSLAILSLLSAPTVAQEQEEPEALPEPTAEQASIDALAIQELYKKHKDAFEGIYGGVSVGETSTAATLKLCEEVIAKIEALEKDVLPEMEPVLARVTELWGPKPEGDEEDEADEDEEPMSVAEIAFQQGGDIEWNMKMAAADNDPAAARDLPEQFDDLGTRYVDLVRMLSNVAETRAANAEYLADSVKNQPEITFFVEDVRVDKLKEYKTLLTYALKFDKSNEYANDRLATLEGEIAAMEKAVEAEIDAGKWASNNTDWGPAAGLAPQVLAFFKAHPNWQANDAQIVAASVRGSWVPAERDIFGRILNWGVPVHVAVTKPKWKEQNRVRVYELTAITQSYAKDPPFASYWVGDSWYIRPSELPGQ